MRSGFEKQAAKARKVAQDLKESLQAWAFLKTACSHLPKTLEETASKEAYLKAIMAAPLNNMQIAWVKNAYRSYIDNLSEERFKHHIRSALQIRDHG